MENGEKEVQMVAGKPKTGKSWLSLGLAVAVATGGLALGSVPVKQGSVLYLALEDNERRLQQRLRQILQDQEVALDDLYLETGCPRLDAGGAEAIREWVDATDDARMVIVDVFTKIRPERSSSDTGYESDYRALAPLKQLADETGVAVVVVHHTRKMAAEDPTHRCSSRRRSCWRAFGARRPGSSCCPTRPRTHHRHHRRRRPPCARRARARSRA